MFFMKLWRHITVRKICRGDNSAIDENSKGYKSAHEKAVKDDPHYIDTRFEHERGVHYLINPTTRPTDSIIQRFRLINY